MNCYRTVHINFAGQNILWEQINILTVHFFDIQSFSIKKSNFKTWHILEMFDVSFLTINLKIQYKWPSLFWFRFLVSGVEIEICAEKNIAIGLSTQKAPYRLGHTSRLQEKYNGMDIFNKNKK